MKKMNRRDQKKMDKTMKKMKKKNDQKKLIDSIFLPSEITIHILSRLPVDSVLQCKGVCKAWRSIVNRDPTFLALHAHRLIKSSSSGGGQLKVIKSAPSAAFCFLMLVNDHNSTTTHRLHFGEYYNNYNAKKKRNFIATAVVKLRNKSIPKFPFHPFTDDKCISSCNGLLLITSKIRINNDTNMFVFNPVTREYVNLPCPPPSLEQERHHGGGVLKNLIRTIGFGYHLSTNEYKVVRITPSSENGGYDDISIYTLGSGRWRNKRKAESSSGKNEHSYSHQFLAKYSCAVLDRPIFRPGVLLNGVLHWIRITTGVVLSFDLADEELKTFPLPPEENPILWDDIHLHLGVLGGCLCLSTSIFCTNHHLLQKSRVDIWVLVMNKDDDQEDYSTTAASCSWTKKFSISTGAARLHGNYELVAALESGKILFSRIVHADSRLRLVTYDPETGYVHDGDESNFVTGRRDGWAGMIPYMKSFVSLKALGEEVGKYVSVENIFLHEDLYLSQGTQKIENTSSPEYLSVVQLCQELLLWAQHFF